MNDQRGFTMVELLVVIMIIGLLAEIAIPAFLGQSSKADDSVAKSAVFTAQTAIETYRLDNGDYYCGATPSALIAIEPVLTQANGLTVSSCAGGDKTQYSLSITSHSRIATVYTVNVMGGIVTRTCSTPGQAGCSASGGW